jgi:hypothetical protein
MSKIRELLAAKPEETPAEETPAETPEAPAKEAPAEETPAKTPDPAPETPAPETPETPADPDDGDEEDDAPQAAILRRLDALEARATSYERENARLRAALADPSFAAAAAKTTRVPASADAAPTLTREAADRAYAKLKTPRERAEYRKAHRDELGLR